MKNQNSEIMDILRDTAAIAARQRKSGPHGRIRTDRSWFFLQLQIAAAQGHAETGILAPLLHYLARRYCGTGNLCHLKMKFYRLTTFS